MKRLVCMILSLALCLSLSVPALAVSVENRFPDKQTYRGFTDVLERDWFYSAVNTCYRVGLMNGTNAGFQPNKVLTAGEVAAIAARIHATVNDAVLPAPSTDPSLPWYQHSMDYLSGLGVSLPTAQNATRLEFVQMLSAVLTDELLEPINTITALPDTSDAAVLRFYNAGILTGVDDYGTFSGGKTPYPGGMRRHGLPHRAHRPAAVLHPRRRALLPGRRDGARYRALLPGRAHRHRQGVPAPGHGAHPLFGGAVQRRLYGLQLEQPPWGPDLPGGRAPIRHGSPRCE